MNLASRDKANTSKKVSLKKDSECLQDTTDVFQGLNVKWNKVRYAKRVSLGNWEEVETTKLLHCFLLGFMCGT